MRSDSGPTEPLEAASLKANFSWTLFGNVCYAASQWCMLVVLAKAGSPELVGRYALAAAVTAPAFMFSNFNLATVQATDARNEYAFGVYLALRLVTSGLSLLVVGAVLAAVGYTSEVAPVILIVGLAKVIESVSDVSYGAFQKHERMELVAKSLMLKGAFSLGALTVALMATGSLVWAVSALAGAWFALLVGYDLRTIRRLEPLRPVWAPRALAALAWLVLPLGLVAGLGSLAAEVPRYLIQGLRGERELGLYVAVISVTAANRMVSMALSRSAAPRLALHLARREVDPFLHLLSRLVLIMLCVGAVGVVFAAVLGRDFLTMAFRPEYADQHAVLVWAMVDSALVTASAFLGTALTAARRFPLQASILTAKFAVTAGVGLVLVPRYGCLGGIWSVMSGDLLSIAAHAVSLRGVVRHMRAMTVGEAP